MSNIGNLPSGVPTPPHRIPMTGAEKQMRARLYKRWAEKHRVYSDTMLSGVTPGQTTRFIYWAHRQGRDKWIYTTQRMFDGKFWSMRYRYVKARGRYELVTSSIRRHGRRKAAAARSRQEADAVH